MEGGIIGLDIRMVCLDIYFSEVKIIDYRINYKWYTVINNLCYRFGIEIFENIFFSVPNVVCIF